MGELQIETGEVASGENIGGQRDNEEDNGGSFSDRTRPSTDKSSVKQEQFISNEQYEEIIRSEQHKYNSIIQNYKGEVEDLKTTIEQLQMALESVRGELERKKGEKTKSKYESFSPRNRDEKYLEAHHQQSLENQPDCRSNGERRRSSLIDGGVLPEIIENQVLENQNDARRESGQYDRIGESELYNNIPPSDAGDNTMRQGHTGRSIDSDEVYSDDRNIPGGRGRRDSSQDQEATFRTDVAHATGSPKPFEEIPRPKAPDFAAVRSYDQIEAIKRQASKQQGPNNPETRAMLPDGRTIVSTT